MSNSLNLALTIPWFISLIFLVIGVIYGVFLTLQALKGRKKKFTLLTLIQSLLAILLVGLPFAEKLSNYFN